MDKAGFIYLLRPNTASLGYALFVAINAAGVWGGVFPFLPMGFQTPEITFWFFLAQSLVFSLCYFASAVGVYFLPGPTRRFLVGLACVPYFIGWCCLIAAIYVDAHALALVIVGGAFLGLGSAGFYMLWQRLFASSETDRGNLDLIRGTAYGAVFYFCLYAIPQAVTAFLIPLVFMPLFGLATVLKSREIKLDQPMFEDVPRENAPVYRALIRDYWRSAFCVGAIGFCAGIMRALAIGEPQIGSLVNLLSMAASLVGAVAMLALWKTQSVRLNVVGMYRIAFPFVITSFLLLPFTTLEYARWQAAILYAVYSVVIVIMMVQCAQASRDRGINPVFIYGFFGGVVYTLHDIGFLAGTFSEQVRVMGIDPMAVTALVSLYLLGLMFFVGQGGFRHMFDHRKSAEDIELVMLDNQAIEREGKAKASHGRTEEGSRASDGQARKPATETAIEVEAATRIKIGAKDEIEASPNGTSAPGATSNSAPGQDEKTPKRDKRNHQEGIELTDRLSKQAQILRDRYRLSARETEVMEYIARGYTVARTAQELVVSENTIRTHSKRIYAKLDVHKKQELIDMLETVEL